MIKLVILRAQGGYMKRSKSEIVDYMPWEFEWQGMTEPERVRKGIFVHCYGHGMFEYLHLGRDVEYMGKALAGRITSLCSTAQFMVFDYE